MASLEDFTGDISGLVDRANTITVEKFNGTTETRENIANFFIPEEFMADSLREIDLINRQSIPYFAKNDTSSIILLMEARKFYKIQSLNRISELAVINRINHIPFGDLYEENVLHGVLDEDNDVILPKQEFIVIGNYNARLQDFCYEALSEMLAYLQKAKLKGKIKQDDKYGNILITNSYIDVGPQYLLLQGNIAAGFKKMMLSLKNENAQIVDHKTFVKKYINFLAGISSAYPLTKSNSILYMNFLQYTSGMMFDIDNSDAGNDIKKYQNFLLSPNFFVFADACKRFGFKIDKNMPWLLYADIRSPAMLGTNGNNTGYLSRYGIKNSKDFFNKRYFKVYQQDLEELKQSFYNAYQIFLSEGNKYYRESDSKLCSQDANKNNVYIRKEVTIEEFFNDFPDSFWIRLYVYFRNIETKKGLTQVQFENIVREATKHINLGYINNALSYVNQHFKDYNYINYVASLQRKTEMLDLPVSNASTPKIIF